MEDLDVCLVEQEAWIWVQYRKRLLSYPRKAASFLRDSTCLFAERHWTTVWGGCSWLGKSLMIASLYWRDCSSRGFRSASEFGSAALLVIMWSCFLSLTSLTCLGYVVTSMGAAAAAVYYVGLIEGLFIVGLFAILILWMYANFWITGTLFVIGGYLFSRTHARLVVLMATVCSVYCVKVRVGWHGVFLSINLAFLSNDVLKYLLQCCVHISDKSQAEERKDAEVLTEDEFSGERVLPGLEDEPEKPRSSKASCKQSAPKTLTEKIVESTSSKVVGQEATSLDEMKRILNSSDHYEALGVHRLKIDAVILKSEYRKKVMLVHPDKNMGSPLASESFKKLHCAYEVLSDSSKRRDYDEQLRKEESRSVCQRSYSFQEGRDYCAKESRRIQCTKCGNSHVWVCTGKIQTTARWCQDCCQHHAAKDGDGWAEYKGSLAFDKPQRMEIPRAFVCAESKIFDVSEWAMCQGMTCRPNTHRPSFHVNMVGLERKTQRSNSSWYPWDVDAETMDEEEEFEQWLQHALASGLFSETSKGRKSWSPFFKLQQLKSKKQWRRVSS